MSIERKLTQFEVHLKQLNLEKVLRPREPLTEELDDVVYEILALKEIKPISRKRAAELQLTANNVKAFRREVNNNLLLQFTDSLRFEAVKAELPKRLKKIRKELYALELVENAEVTLDKDLPLFLGE